MRCHSTASESVHSSRHLPLFFLVIPLETFTHMVSWVFKEIVSHTIPYLSSSPNCLLDPPHLPTHSTSFFLSNKQTKSKQIKKITARQNQPPSQKKKHQKQPHQQHGFCYRFCSGFLLCWPGRRACLSVVDKPRDTPL